jgi:hypothetical protein
MKRVMIGVAVLLVAIQFIRPEKPHAEEHLKKNIRAFVKMEDTIYKTLIRSCGDCHSNTTKWPWYSEIAPFSWVVTGDVENGRRHLNFSEWGNYTPKKMSKKLNQIAEVMADSSMPLASYVLMHKEAKLSSAEMKMLEEWAEEEADKFRETEEKKE